LEDDRIGMFKSCGKKCVEGVYLINSLIEFNLAAKDIL
jgi:hypothetical protein